MNSLWKIVRTALAIIGGLLIFGGVGTSDYYLLELGEPEPAHVWRTIVIGLFMMTPFIVHMVYTVIKEHEDVENR